MKHGLSTETVEQIKSCLASNAQIEEAVLYGSRAKGNHRPGSDIDLVLKGSELKLSDVLRLETQLDDLLLPYKFDVSIYHKIRNRELLEHIDRAGRVFYKKSVVLNR